MDTFAIPIEIAGPDRERFATVDVLVDTGAPYTMLPASFLRSLGVSPIDRYRFALPDGERICMDVGDAFIRIDGRVRPTVVVFADEDSRPVLGRVTLAAFCLDADTANKRLISIDAFA